MSAAVRASVVIRAKDEAGSIGRTLQLLAGQELPHEVIVVDSGSSDATAEIARAAGSRVIEIPADSFTYGGALNTGCEAASAPVLVALSAHAFPPDPGWLGRMVAAVETDQVACATGAEYGPGYRPLKTVWLQDARSAQRDPFWGYSNSAGAFRAELWRERPFRTDMPFTEDREWAWGWLHSGWQVAVAPDLVVDHDHSRDGLRTTYRRARLEFEGYACFLELQPWSRRDLLKEWWTQQGWHRSRTRARLDPRRMARLAGIHRARKEATWRPS